MVKKIGFDAFAFRMQSYGGISKQFQEIINGINGIHNNKFIKAVITEQIPDTWHDRLDAKSIAIDNYGNKYIKAAMRRLPRFQEDKLDLLHLTYYHKSPLAFQKKPFAITIHDFTPEMYPELMELDNVHLDKMMLIQQADLIFCVSETTKSHLLHFFPKIPRDKIKLAYPGPSIQKSQNKFVRDRPYFLIVGRNDRYKNLEIVFQAIPHFPDFDFVFFGMDRNDIPAKYLIQSGGQISCLKGDSDLLSMYYSGAEAYLNPSFSEGFCIPVLDSLVSNCPALVSNIEVFHELYGNSVGYFDPKKVESLIDSMHQINSLKLGPFSKEKFSWEKSVEIHIKSYLNLLN